MRIELRVVGVAMLWLCCGSLLTADEPSEVPAQTIRATIEKGLPYLAAQGDDWIEKKDCVSCHRVAFTAWTHIAAQRAGIDVDRNRILQWIDWCQDDLLQPIAEAEAKFSGEQKIDRNYSGGAQVLAFSMSWELSEGQKVKQRQVIEKLLAGQQTSGGWEPKGQLPAQKRELMETTHVVTLWNALFLRQILEQEEIDRQPMEQAIESARLYVSGYEKGRSTEWVALRAWMDRRADGQTMSGKYLQRLLSKQNADGGWGWIEGESSDVLASAQALYVLVQLGFDSKTPSVSRVVSFLLEQQTKNGSWKVRGTKRKAADRVTETATYWGSAWSVIALGHLLAAENKDGS